MVTMESIKNKLGFDPLTYNVTNKELSTGDGDFNPFSVLSVEELNFVMDELRENAKKKIA